jgi:hypothetical protein
VDAEGAEAIAGVGVEVGAKVSSSESGDISTKSQSSPDVPLTLAFVEIDVLLSQSVCLASTPYDHFLHRP